MKRKKIKITLLAITVILMLLLGARAMINGLGANAEAVTNTTDSAGLSANTNGATMECAGTDALHQETQNPNGATANIGHFEEATAMSEVTDWKSLTR